MVLMCGAGSVRRLLAAVPPRAGPAPRDGDVGAGGRGGGRAAQQAGGTAGPLQRPQLPVQHVRAPEAHHRPAQRGQPADGLRRWQNCEYLYPPLLCREARM